MQVGSHVPLGVIRRVLLQRGKVLEQPLVHGVEVLQHGHARQRVEQGSGGGGREDRGQGAGEVGGAVHLCRVVDCDCRLVRRTTSTRALQTSTTSCRARASRCRHAMLSCRAVVAGEAVGPASCRRGPLPPSLGVSGMRASLSATSTAAVPSTYEAVVAVCARWSTYLDVAVGSGLFGCDALHVHSHHLRAMCDL